jgi:segregation and condensation protein A
VAFAALLEAKKQGEVKLWQQENFGTLEVEIKTDRW